MAPEVVAKEKYGLPSYLWSVGIVLLETLMGELTVNRDKAAARIIEEKKATLAKSPFVELVCGLLEPDVDKQLSAPEALTMPIFEIVGFEILSVCIIVINSVFSSEQDEKNDENKMNSNAMYSNAMINKKSKYEKTSPRERLSKKLRTEP